MQPNDPPLLVASTDQLGPANKAQPLVERLRTDVLWHQRRGNDTIARDCQEAADELERLRADAMALRKLLQNSQTAVCVANRKLVLDDMPGKIAEALFRTAYLRA